MGVDQSTTECSRGGGVCGPSVIDESFGVGGRIGMSLGI